MSESNTFLSRRLNPTESSVCLENFKHYRRFNGCGIPRRVIRSFN